MDHATSPEQDATHEITTVAKHKPNTRPGMAVTIRIGSTADGARVMLRRRAEMREIVLGTPDGLKAQALVGTNVTIRDFAGNEYVLESRDLMRLLR